ncbi:hypothetical protein SDC9_79021 [bioreactor metagenome]|uniref:DUF871 domain-containing protein n=1 Tax=bioreactor metagenome TaxID=1076179 RepID=A0A644YVV6_9ZZZZ
MLGISVYFKDIDYNYLKEASRIGVKYVFTSLHIPEEDYSDLDEKLPQLLKFCNEFGLYLVPDISPKTFEMLKIKNRDYNKLKDLGFTTLRLDYGFDDFDTIKILLENFNLMLNSSVINKEYLEKAFKSGINFKNISLTYNFYPKSNTGLSIDFFNKKNEDFKKYGLKIQAFIPGDDLKRFPLYEGLPTVEKHRKVNPYIAAVELIHQCGVDDVLIGDSRAKIGTLEFIISNIDHKTMTIKVHFEKDFENLYGKEYMCRKDLSESIIRLRVDRKTGIRPYSNGYRRRGSITLDNELMGRYCGEIQLLKKDLDVDSRVNVIGFIHPDYIELLDYIDTDTKIKFSKI